MGNFSNRSFVCVERTIKNYNSWNCFLSVLSDIVVWWWWSWSGLIGQHGSAPSDPMMLEYRMGRHVSWMCTAHTQQRQTSLYYCPVCLLCSLIFGVNNEWLSDGWGWQASGIIPTNIQHKSHPHSLPTDSFIPLIQHSSLKAIGNSFIWKLY